MVETLEKDPRRMVRIEQAALATYLAELGFEDLVLPAGLPKTEVPSTSAGETMVGGGTRSARSGPRTTPGSRSNRPAPKTSKAIRGPLADGAAGATAASFDIAVDLSEAERVARLGEIREHAAGCVTCALSQKRNLVVFGSGNETADLMLVGEGPGAREDQQGEPFVGPAGELLTKMLSAIELERSSVYIANVVKCRPPGNRDPKPEEVVACSGYLEAQIKLIRPRIILTLGRVATQALLVSQESLGRLRNQWHAYQGVPVWVTYHPAALLRNSSYKKPAWEDLQVVRDQLAKLAEADSGPTS